MYMDVGQASPQRRASLKCLLRGLDRKIGHFPAYIVYQLVHSPRVEPGAYLERDLDQ